MQHLLYSKRGRSWGFQVRFLFFSPFSCRVVSPVPWQPVVQQTIVGWRNWSGKLASRIGPMGGVCGGGMCCSYLWFDASFFALGLTKYLRVQRGLALAYWVHMSCGWTHAGGGLQRFPVPGLQACYPHPGHFFPGPAMTTLY